MKRDIYKMLSIWNDIDAIFKGRIIQRLWNRTVLKMLSGLMR